MSTTTLNRKGNRILDRAQEKKTELFNEFSKEFAFDKIKMDWDPWTAIHFEYLNNIWKTYCRKKKLLNHLNDFRLKCHLLRTKLILSYRYQATTTYDIIAAYLNQDLKPIDAAIQIVVDDQYTTL
ncbi:MAG: hypothetical protein JEY96_01700 [Bacteroidales bacterium]|nr:hypothetical protein [Bacteroidales bacterium]